MSKHNFSVSCPSICGHTEVVSFTYGAKSGNAQSRMYTANTLCGECINRLKEVLAPVEKGFFKLDLPTLAGTPRSVAYANSLRIQRLRLVGPIMAKLEKSDEPFAKVALAVFKMMFKITSAAYWINGKDLKNDWNWMAFEVAALMRKTRNSAVNPMPNSAHAYWLTMNHAVIAEAATALQLLPPISGIEQPVPEVGASCAAI
jgi:hypothetical protein